MFAQIVEGVCVGLGQPIITFTLLREAQIYTHIIYQEMARATNCTV
jgi:hypothetical protein